MNTPTLGTSWDPVWEEVFKQQSWGKYPSEDTIRFIARNYYRRERNQVKILEVGSGPGANIWYAAREGFDVYGIDGSPAAIKQCQQRLTSEELTANLQLGDILSLPYPDETFDAILDIECLCCNNSVNTSKILKEISRALKPNGKFYSRSFSDQLYIGKKNNQLSPFEFDNISDGPLADKGFLRLIDKTEINRLYGEVFAFESIDLAEYTQNNGSISISEWHITCTKK